MSALESPYPTDQHHSESTPPDTSTQQRHPQDLSFTVQTPAYSLPPLPAYTYGQLNVKVPLVSTNFEQSPTETTVNSAVEPPERNNPSPDPHEFYRRYQDSFSRGSREHLRQGDIVVGKRDDDLNMSRHYRRQSPPSSRTSGSKASPLSARAYAPHGSRYASTTSAEHSPLNSAKSNSALSDTTRNRQTSLKDLVNRFNQTPDEVPPLPQKTNSRSTSAHSNSGNSNPATHISYARARTSSQSKDHSQELSHRMFLDGGQQQTRTPRHQRRGRPIEDVAISPRSHAPISIDSASYASQSMIDLARSSQVSRKPLFGEVLGSSEYHPGYGISNPGRRRGSEGNMRDPNPVFSPDEQKNQESPAQSPSSPSDWYLGVTPTLNEIKTERVIPELPSRRHRRTRSDFTGIQHLPSTTYQPAAAVPLSPPNPSPPPSPTKRMPTSPSRIPLSTHRMSLQSDTGNSTPSTRVNSAAGGRLNNVVPPPRGSSALPKAAQPPSSPVRNARSSPSRYSPRRGRNSPAIQHLSTSPRLNAYISAPLPKKSPPLRSSRPRQPVSTASTSASRARAVERFTGHENGQPKSPRQHRNRRPPDLGGVDFAARRQKIQEAFTHTVKENERLEEKRRASIAQDVAVAPQSNENERNREGSVHDDQAQGHASPKLDVTDSQEQEKDEDVFRTPAEELPKSERELTINTNLLSERSVLDMSQEDSPTLGGFNRFSHIDEEDTSTPSETEPVSAVTAGTADSVGTFFDDEPQDRTPSPREDHPTLLSHIMSIRDQSPSSPTSVRRPRTAGSSDKDDEESIHIMLGDTPVLEKSRFNDLHEGTSREASASEQPGNRWSMSSWTSSSKSKDRQSERQSLDNERDGRMARIDELSPPQAQQNTHLSVSTATSAHTQQPWSPATFSSPLTNASVRDSDAYSTINRVLDHYHDPNVVSPEMMNDVQQHIFTQSPDLARQGGWDPKKVTQLYLQELARNRFAQPNGSPEHPKAQNKAQASRHSPRTPLGEEKIVHAGPQRRDSTDFTEGLEVASNHDRSASLEVDDGENRLHRASLNHPDDWNMSPSIGDWIHLQAADSPSDEKPSLPPKDWSAYKKELSQTKTKGDLQDSVSSSEFRPQLPEIQGLGLEIGINVTSPQDDDSPAIPPPPLPDHTPPPPPIAPTESKAQQVRSPPSPSVYSKHIASTITRHDLPAGLPMQTSTDSSQIADTRASSAQPSINSSVSLAPTGTESIAAPSEAELKRLTRRRNIIKELVDTEHSFGQDMKVVEDIYKGTSNVLILSAEDVKILFSNSDRIVAFSTDFLDTLKQAAKSVYLLPKSKRWRSNRMSNATSHSGATDDQSSISGVDTTDEERDRQTFIGDAFSLHMAEMEKVYAEYLKNHDAANQKLVALQKNETIKIWLKECRAYAHDLTTAWDLDSLLVKPVQRVLKYPLLLDQLLEVTPENHPDWAKLDIACREMKGISMRINEMKRRADVMEQLTNKRQRKDSDGRLGLSKAFGRRTEKLRQQVGLSDMVEDKDYNAVSEKFGFHYFQLQVVMRDVEMYTNDVQIWMNRFSDFVMAIESHIDVAQTSYPEVESKWRKFRMSTREMSMTALTDHVNAVRKNVIEPMTTLLKLHDSPQKLMQKRNKRVMDFARYKSIKDRGDKPDKKTTEQGEQFVAINESLKDELPRLFNLTGKLVEACLNNFVQLQLQWHIIWRRKLGQALDNYKASGPISELIDAFTGDFAFFEAQVLSLGICNGSMLAESVNMVNMLSPSRTLTGDDASQKKPSLDLTRRRTTSINSDMSPVLPQPDFGSRNGAGGFFGMDTGMQPMPSMAPTSNQLETTNRNRANSAMVAGRSPRTPDVPGGFPYSNNTTPISASFGRPATATGPSPVLPRPIIETPDLNRVSEATTLVNQPVSNTLYAPGTQARPPSPSGRYSGVFSSALPMSDSPTEESPLDDGQSRPQTQFNVIFLAASVYEFNIDRARREAGYPYLTYVAGEIFDVIGEKGELWLAKNQDDRTNQVGWIWNKHFCKLAS
ncbi:MAG: hypothetical protein Q9218_005967 [Villophora microphyllina]